MAGEQMIPQDLLPPIAFTTFQTVRELPQASAASGLVFRMKAPQSGADCVFKLITVPLRTEEEISNSIQAIRSVWGGTGAHDNIVTFFDCDYDRSTSRFVIVTEWMDGLSLFDHMGTQLPEAIVGGIASQTLHGLAHLHKKLHTAHRDLKPSNILLNSAGQAKITDLGQGRQLDSTMDQAGTYVGSQVYMSPERLQGVSYTSNCDVWSLGLIALECAMGRYPYLEEGQAKDDIAGIIFSIEDSPPPRLDVAGYSTQARDFCDKCLVQLKERRPHSIQLLEDPWVQAHAAAHSLPHIAAWVQAKIASG
mmetsp:Transcript_27300/g.55782  ORF Transcript_27300/g.55782 Transcript_27300/m.55782 type:complete len:307 (-) Transcript_27300:49-969(-)